MPEVVALCGVENPNLTIPSETFGFIYPQGSSTLVHGDGSQGFYVKSVKPQITDPVRRHRRRQGIRHDRVPAVTMQLDMFTKVKPPLRLMIRPTKSRGDCKLVTEDDTVPGMFNFYYSGIFAELCKDDKSGAGQVVGSTRSQRFRPSRQGPLYRAGRGLSAKCPKTREAGCPDFASAILL